MITLRCTRKLLKFLDIVPDEILKPPTAALGDWYANLIPTIAGNLIIFVNERTLLTVALPVREAADLVPMFCLRVINLFGMIGVSAEAAARELSHLAIVRFGKTASRSVLGSMKEIAWDYQLIAEDGEGKGQLSLSDAEEELSRRLWSALGYRYPTDVAKELLQGEMGSDGCQFVVFSPRRDDGANKR